MASYQASADRAAKRIKDKGLLATFSYESGGAFDPVLGSESGTSTATFTGYAVRTTYSKLEIDGTVVKRGDIRLLTEQTSEEIKADYKCAFDGVDYRVMAVDPLSPSDIVIINKVQLRK